MLSRFAAWLTGRLIQRGRVHWPLAAALFLVFLAPALLVAVVSYAEARWHLTGYTLSRRQTVVSLAATTLKAGLDRLMDIGKSLATRVRFRQLVAQGRWSEAIEIMKNVPGDFPAVDRLLLTDTRGVLMADTPAVPGALGKDFSYRDWYRGVTRDWQPYLSEVYTRAAEPAYNVFSVALPVRDDAQRVAGILVLQVRADVLLQWAPGLDVGPFGSLYFVDARGHAAAHPGHRRDGEVVDLSRVPAVARALRGERGAEVGFNPVDRRETLAAYEPVHGYGWAAIIEQPPSAAFATRDRVLRGLALAYGGIVLLGGATAFLMLRVTVERRRAEIEMGRIQSFLDSVFENIPNMIFVKDARELRFVRLNRAGEDLLGRARNELIGRNDYDFFPPEQAAFFTAKDRAVLERREPLDIPEEPITTRGGACRILHTKKVAIVDSHGEPLYLLGISEDVTERKRAVEQIESLNRALKQRAEQLEAVNRELEAFSYSVSHDLRAPLRHIDGYADMLQRRLAAKLDDTDRRHFQNVLGAAKRMGNLIDDLLVFSRMGRSEMRRSRVELSEMVKEVLRDLHEEARGRRIEWKIAPLPDVSADPAMLRLALDNLISNAVKYTRKQAEACIEIGAQRPEGETVVFIRDNGVGFDMRYADKLFGVFQRLHREEEFEGTGIGLANVRRIIARHGGRTWAVGEVDHGATFYFSLPRPQEA